MNSLQVFRAQSVLYSNTADLFGTSTKTAVQGLDDVCSEFNRKRETWTMVHDFERVTIAWKCSPLREMQLGVLQEHVEAVGRAAAAACKSQRGDMVVLRLKNTVDSFRQLLPLIKVCIMLCLTCFLALGG
jgi:hypothetical protein